METARWKRRINAALDAGAVVQVVEQFMGALEPADWKKLPADLRAAKIRNANDVTHWAFTLAAASLAQGAGEDSPLADVSAILAEASRRLAQVSPPGLVGVQEEDEPIISLGGGEPDVLVYDYEYWDEEQRRLVKADWSAPLELIRNGLGQPIIPSGRKIKISELDDSGRAPIVPVAPLAPDTSS